MARPQTETEDEPLDPAVEKVRRKLVRFVAINLSLLFVAVMAVVGAIVYKTGNEAPKADASVGLVPSPPEGGMLEGEISLPTGARLLSQSFSGNRILLDVLLADGQQALFIYDIAAKSMVGRFSVMAK